VEESGSQVTAVEKQQTGKSAAEEHSRKASERTYEPETEGGKKGEASEKIYEPETEGGKKAEASEKAHEPETEGEKEAEVADDVRKIEDSPDEQKSDTEAKPKEKGDQPLDEAKDAVRAPAADDGHVPAGTEVTIQVYFARDHAYIHQRLENYRMLLIQCI